MRIYDPRVGKFLSVDPITKEYPELTPYQFASNTPIQAIDLDGLEKYHYSLNFDKKGTASLKLTSVENFSEWTWKPELGNTAFGFQLWEKVKNPYKEHIVEYNTTEYVVIAPIAAKVESTYKLPYDNLPNINTIIDDLDDKIESTQVKTAAAQGFAGGLSTGRVRKGHVEASSEGPTEAYNRNKHYGRTPTAADRKALGATTGEVVDHQPELVKRYYEGDPATGEKPGYKMTDAERKKSAQDRSRMQLQKEKDSQKQGGHAAQYSKEQKKKNGL